MSKDSPALAYSLQDVLRQMFKCGADLLLYKDGRGNLIIEKDRIIVQLGRKDDLTLRELIAHISSEDKQSFKKSLPAEQPFNKSQRVLCVTPDGFTDSTLEVLRKTSNPALGLPVWWDVPIPILRFFNDEIKLNDCGSEILSSPEDLNAVKNYLINFTKGKNKQHDGDALEISLTGKALLLHNIGEGHYRIEDISPDFDMAQELAWWAAVGHSLSERLTQSGAAIERIRPEDVPKNKKISKSKEGTVKLLLGDVPCLWDGELLGYMRIALQEQDKKTNISELLGILEGE